MFDWLYTETYVRLNFKAGLLLGCLDDVDHLVMGGFVAFFWSMLNFPCLQLHSVRSGVVQSWTSHPALLMLTLIFNECRWFDQLFKAILELPESGQSRRAVADVVERQLVVCCRSWAQPLLCWASPSGPGPATTCSVMKSLQVKCRRR